jgi:hypothetical protein
VSRGFRYLVVLTVLIVGGVFFAAGRLMRPVRLAPAVPAPAWPAGAEAPIAPFEAALARYVRDDGGAEYARWRDDAAAVSALDSYLAYAAAYSPRRTPERFPRPVDRLRYWLLGAQALQVRIVLTTAVDDVLALPAPLSSIPGDGLLRRFAFPFGGEPQTLLGLVRDFLAADLDDPRLVFALGGVAPALGPLARAIPADPASFETFLAARTAGFFANPGSFALSADGATLALGPRVFLWRDALLGRKPTPGGPDPDALLRETLARYAPAEIAPRLRATPPPAIRPAAADWRVR